MSTTDHTNVGERVTLAEALRDFGVRIVPAWLLTPGAQMSIPTRAENDDGILTVERRAFHEWWIEGEPEKPQEA